MTFHDHQLLAKGETEARTVSPGAWEIPDCGAQIMEGWEGCCELRTHLGTSACLSDGPSQTVCPLPIAVKDTVGMTNGGND